MLINSISRFFLSKGKIMKKLSQIAAALLLAAGAVGAQAGTASATIPVTGTYTTVCSISTTSIALGEVALDTKVVHPTGFPAVGAVAIPLNIGVTCNYSDAPWKLYNTGGNITVTIGGSTNLGSYLTANTSTAPTATAGAPINGIGTSAASVFLLVSPGGGNTTRAWLGAGAISASLPLTVEF
jgi:hypothetical protein